MTHDPRSVIVIQSPCRHTPGPRSEVRVAVALAGRVVPEPDGHRGHRARDDQLALLVDQWLALGREGLDGAAERAAADLALPDRHEG